jgi:hypothetical protein
MRVNGWPRRDDAVNADKINKWLTLAGNIAVIAGIVALALFPCPRDCLNRARRRRCVQRPSAIEFLGRTAKPVASPPDARRSRTAVALDWPLAVNGAVASGFREKAPFLVPMPRYG